MTGPEMMIAKLIGIKPEELRAQVNQAIDLMKSGAAAAAQIQSDLACIKAHLGITDEKGILNGRTIAHSGSRADNNRIEL